MLRKVKAHVYSKPPHEWWFYYKQITPVPPLRNDWNTVFFLQYKLLCKFYISQQITQTLHRSVFTPQFLQPFQYPWSVMNTIIILDFDYLCSGFAEARVVRSFLPGSKAMKCLSYHTVFVIGPWLACFEMVTPPRVDDKWYLITVTPYPR